MKLLLIIALTATVSCDADSLYANSFIRPIQVGEGFNLETDYYLGSIKSIDPYLSPIGKYIRGMWPDIIDELSQEEVQQLVKHMDVLEKFEGSVEKSAKESAIEKKLTRIVNKEKKHDVRLGGLNRILDGIFLQVLVEADKDPVYEKARSAIQEILKQSSNNITTALKQARAQLNDQFKLLQKKKEYVNTFAGVALKTKEFEEFKDAWERYKNKCLQEEIANQKKFEKMVQKKLEQQHKQLKEPGTEDIEDMIGAALGINIGSICMSQLPYGMLSEFPIGMDGGSFYPYLIFGMSVIQEKTKDCAALREESRDLYHKLVEVVNNNPVTINAAKAYQAVMQKIEEELYKIEKDQNTLAYISEREAGIEEHLLVMRDIITRLVQKWDVLEKIKKFKKTIPEDVIKAQSDFDALVDKALDREEAKIQKIIAERKAQKVASVKTA